MRLIVSKLIRNMYGSRVTLLIGVAMLIIGNVSARAVNISNTWMLPEEGFPVFYRYFRDRISWNEADAVCQFHHANLVTVDTTSQYDAIRAYLKELDIASNVWIGLSRSVNKPKFAWRDFHYLSSLDYWQEALPIGNDPLCAAMDPAADFRWHALTCGGPEVASFICELPVPFWASGPKGCFITELPSLTVLFIPEQSAVELTSDCGLGGTKRIICKGNVDRDEMIRRLACTNDMLQDKIQPLAKQTTVNHQNTYAHTNLNIGNVGNTSNLNLANFMNAVTSLATGYTIATGFSEPTVSSSSRNNNISGGGSVDTKTTKPWIWTSNTVDSGDYGLPTRHRRETEEDTVVPLLTKTTTEISADRSSKHRISAKTTFKYISATPKPWLQPSQTTSDLKDSQSTTRIVDNNISMLTEPTNYVEINSGVTSTPTTETKPESEEFASAINQGQLFSIIENGTMFDIIELNGTDENKTLGPDVKLISAFTETLRISKQDEFTTVIYHREPTDGVDIMIMSHKSSLTPAGILPSALASKNKEEVPEYSIIGNSQNSSNFNVIKLNRTFRKEVPREEDNGFQKPGINIDMDVDKNFEIFSDISSVTKILSPVTIGTQQGQNEKQKIVINKEIEGNKNIDGFEERLPKRAKNFKEKKVCEEVEKVEKNVKDIEKSTEKLEEPKRFHLVEISLHGLVSNASTLFPFVTTRGATDKKADNKPTLISANSGPVNDKRKTRKTLENVSSKSKYLKSNTYTDMTDKASTNTIINNSSISAVKAISSTARKTKISEKIINTGITTKIPMSTNTNPAPAVTVIQPITILSELVKRISDGQKDIPKDTQIQDIQKFTQIEEEVEPVEKQQQHTQIQQVKQQVKAGLTKGATHAHQLGESTVKAGVEMYFDSEPTLKPNRQRQLTRSNRRSFYPYFFSRVLG